MLKFLSLLLLLLVGSFHFIKCGLSLPGRCPDVKIIENFDLYRYMGTWYHHSKYHYIEEERPKCLKEIWKKEENGTISWELEYVLFNKTSTVRATAKFIKPGQMSTASKYRILNFPYYFILGTDYHSWAVLYNCVNERSFRHIQTVWILTRARQPTREAIAAAKSIMKDNKLSEKFLVKTIQTGCPGTNDSIDVNQEAGTIKCQLFALFCRTY